MKTVGLMTFFESSSIGANLQAFALQTEIEKIGCETEIINYDRKGDNVNKSKKKGPKDHFISIISGCVNVLSKKNKQLTQAAFLKFRSERLKIAQKRYHNYEELRSDPPSYDAYVTGSDQVWNPYTGVRLAYFLSFVDDHSKKIAYAPSIGVKKIGAEYEYIFKDNVKNFKSLSCREKVGASEISRIVSRNVETVLDPTLLITPGEWDTYANEIKLPKKKYMLCYFLGSLKSSRRTAQRVAKEKGLEILDIPASPADLLWNVRKAKGVGPAEFLYLVKHASYICTDSFHGTAFSVNYGKPFLCFQRRGYSSAMSFGSRLENILEITGLEKCLVLENSSEYCIDYASEHVSESQKCLEKQRQISKQYLRDAIMGN